MAEDRGQKTEYRGQGIEDGRRRKADCFRKDGCTENLAPMHNLLCLPAYFISRLFHFDASVDFIFHSPKQEFRGK